MPMRVALTFDGEHPSQPHQRSGAVDEILQLLSDRGVTATFFLQGTWAEAYPDTARRIARDRHLIGSHSYHHARLPLLSGNGIRADTLQARSIIRETSGADPHPWFRAPYGAVDLGVLADLSRLGCHHIGWDVDPGDWKPERPSDELARRVLEGIRQHPNGAVVLLHTWPGTTADALPRIVSELRSGGADFVTVADLGPPRWPPNPTGVRGLLVRSPAMARLARRTNLLLRGRSGSGADAP
jgi:peptidoglycan-N-acetylglucosamine deacetylase